MKKIALVTGSSRGIGRGIALELACEGWDICVNYIRQQGGTTTFNDKSAAEAIYDVFGVSKKTFKRAVGDLYKKRLIELTDTGIKLV